MKIGIIGSRGIPNYYGGFEQFAEYLAKGMVDRGHNVTVYNSHTHPYQKSEWNGVRLIHCNDPEDKWGTMGQFVYDLNCIFHTRKENYDVILQLGYTSSSIWGWLLPMSNSIVTTNMDGLEWKRTKYSRPVQWFLKKAEYLATVFSHYWIADSLGIQEHLLKEYKTPSVYIPYGAHPFVSPNDLILAEYNLEKEGYNMLIARLEPENNIDVILEGVTNASGKNPFLVIGKHDTTYGEYLKAKYKNVENIRFVGGIYNLEDLNNLRHYSNLYFHGHSVGGTNPSLLEAMASNSLICAHKNIFNTAILGEDAIYFSDSTAVADYIDSVKKKDYTEWLNSNTKKVQEIYHWDKIIDQYEQHFKSIWLVK